jgi:mycothiol synthase
VSSWTIEEWPLRDQSDELLSELYQAREELHLEWAPGDPRRPLADEVARLRNLPEPMDGVMIVARDDAGSVAGISECSWEQLEGWRHICWVEVRVLPAGRRQGLGRLLLDRSVTVAERRGSRLIMGQTRENVPSGAAFCRHFGAEPGQVGRENRLDLRSVDRALVDRWIADGPVRAPGYRLEFVDGSTPPELADRVAEVLNVMNTAPRDDLDFGDTQITPELLRQYEEAGEKAGRGHWAYYAVDEASGRFVGTTDITIRPGNPDRVHVGDTGVDPAHRGKSLGKWLKAAMTRRILDGLPDVRWVITFNAASNDAMLAINNQLGFRQSAVTTMWQVPTSDLRARLTTVSAVSPGSPGAPDPDERGPAD